MHLAVQRGDVYIIGDMILCGAVLDAQDAQGNTPLHYAIDKDLPVVHLLLELGANTNLQNKEGYTPLHKACQKGDERMVEILVHYGATVITKTRAGKTAEELLLDKNQGIQALSPSLEIKPIFSSPMRARELCNNNERVLIDEKKSLRKIKVLEKHGVAVILQDGPFSNSIKNKELCEQCTGDYSDQANPLGGLGANNTHLRGAPQVSTENRFGSRVVSFSPQEEDLVSHIKRNEGQEEKEKVNWKEIAAIKMMAGSIVGSFLNVNYNPDEFVAHYFEQIRKSDDESLAGWVLIPKEEVFGCILHEAAKVGVINTIKYLVKKHPYLINRKDALGRTPLYYASTEAVAMCLLDHGALLHFKDNEGCSPLDFVNKDKKRKEEVKNFLSFCLKIQSSSSDSLGANKSTSSRLEAMYDVINGTSASGGKLFRSLVKGIGFLG